MEGKNNTEKTSNQKKARRLFWGMLAHLQPAASSIMLLT